MSIGPEDNFRDMAAMLYVAEVITEEQYRRILALIDDAIAQSAPLGDFASRVNMELEA